MTSRARNPTQCWALQTCEPLPCRPQWLGRQRFQSKLLSARTSTEAERPAPLGHRRIGNRRVVSPCPREIWNLNADAGSLYSALVHTVTAASEAPATKVTKCHQTGQRVSTPPQSSSGSGAEALSPGTGGGCAAAP